MAATPEVSPLIAIVGETASGKTALALELARRFGGEIVCADSRTVYKGMDIGTAKPTAAERTAVPHHLLDVVAPDETFTAADFKRLANDAMTDISGRGRLSIMVGGTGLYVDAVLFDFAFGAAADPEIRQELSVLSVRELQQRIHDAGLKLPENAQNPRHLIRTLETNGSVGSRKPLRENTLVIGLQLNQQALHERVVARVDEMIRIGLVDELSSLVERYGWEASALQTPGYKAFRKYLNGAATLEEAKALFVQNDIQYAKRQRTWFKRNNSIHWVSDRESAVDLVTTFLSK